MADQHHNDVNNNKQKDKHLQWKFVYRVVIIRSLYAKILYWITWKSEQAEMNFDVMTFSHWQCSLLSDVQLISLFTSPLVFSSDNISSFMPFLRYQRLSVPYCTKLQTFHTCTIIAELKITEDDRIKLSVTAQDYKDRILPWYWQLCEWHENQLTLLHNILQRRNTN